MTGGDAATSRPIAQSVGEVNRRLGPHYVPRIECGKCGREWHMDAGGGPCPECSGFLREPTDAEHRQLADFMDWKYRHEHSGVEHGA